MHQNQRRTIRTTLAAAGHAPEQIAAALTWASGHKSDDVIENYNLAMSRLLYTDEQLAAGVRFDPTTPPPAKRRRGRPSAAQPLTPTERDQRHRERHDLVSIRVSRTVADALDAQAAQHGDRSRLAVIRRLLAHLE